LLEQPISPTNLGSLITTKAELLGYSHPRDIRQFRSEAALLVKAWKDYDQALISKYQADISPGSPSSPGTPVLIESDLGALTVEMKSGNAIVLLIQPRLLLVLVGCNAASGDVGQTRFHAEAKDDARYPPEMEYPGAIHFPTNLEPEATALSPTDLLQGSGSADASPAKSPQMDGTQVWAGEFTTPMDSAFKGRATSGEVPPVTPSDDEVAEAGSAAEADAEECLKILNFQRTKVENMADMLRDTLRTSTFVVQDH
jgi:hypothetical protein